MRSLAPLLALVPLALLGCPAKVPEGAAAEGKAVGDPTPPNVPVTAPDDPRVVRDTDDLYDLEVASPPPSPDQPGPGSGVPDETNGVCRLYAPKLPHPECCPVEVGFDAEAIRQLCGHPAYLGESLQKSCGYFFAATDPAAKQPFMRGSRLIDTSVATAAKEHDERMRHTLSKPEFASTPVPGVEGALWSSAEGLHWAFLPGWEHVRLISWNDGACPDEKMPEVLALITNAAQPPENAPREGMLPTARKPKPATAPGSEAATP
jgi:hypothetical protein